MNYCAEVKMTWLDSENNYEPTSTVQIFRGYSKENLDLNILEYSQRCGSIHTEILSEKEITQ